MVQISNSFKYMLYKITTTIFTCVYFNIRYLAVRWHNWALQAWQSSCKLPGTLPTKTSTNFGKSSQLSDSTKPATFSLYCLEVDVVTLCCATRVWMIWIETTSSVGINLLEKTWLQGIKRHQKASKGIKRHQKASKGIKRHQKASRWFKLYRILSGFTRLHSGSTENHRVSDRLCQLHRVDMT